MKIKNDKFRPANYISRSELTDVNWKMDASKDNPFLELEYLGKNGYIVLIRIKDC